MAGFLPHDPIGGRNIRVTMARRTDGIVPAMPTVDRSGVPIYYETHGDLGDPVLLLMGLGTDAHGWELQVPAFAARHRVLLLDNRGIGRSGKPPGPYSIAQLADDAVAVLDAVGLARAHVVGLSMGGMIAQEIALSHPARLGALVLAATFARPAREVLETTERGSQAVAGAPSLLGLLGRGAGGAAVDPLQMMRFLMPLVFSKQFLRERRDWLFQFFARSMGYGFSMEAFFGQVSAVLAHDTTSRLGGLSLPTLVITGTADALVPPHHSDELSRLIPGARLLRFEGATHGLQLEIADRFNASVLEFLAAHPL
ncbi:MAG: alpha/beta fold hydrolase [Myxococcales bacterium]|nr:alpha/beta fold hydrolase [Myxococcales bacterium]